MLCNSQYEDRLDRLLHQLRLAPAATADLIGRTVADVCLRLPTLKEAGKAARLDHLIAAGAWTDAALALVELELPGWKLRRLVYEDGQWLCSLSQQINLPASLDDTADATHEVLPLAILIAFLEARRRSTAAREIRSPSVPRTAPAADYPVWCDDYA